jgi:LacI family transcriptional regulator
VTGEHDNKLAGGGRPTISDVARLAGVSKKTVSRVVNDSPFVSASTRAAVQAVIGRTGYVPDPHARGLAFGRSSLVGFAYERGEAGRAMACQAGLLEGLDGGGLEVLVRAVPDWSEGTLAELEVFFQRQRLFGMVLAGGVARPGWIGVDAAGDGYEGGRRAAAALLARSR